MTAILVGLLVGLVGVVAVLGTVVVAQRNRIRTLEHDLGDPVPARGDEVIVVRINNHAEIAASRVSLVRPVAKLVPSVIEAIVHREAVRLLRDELPVHGVDADVRLRRWPHAPASTDDGS